MFYHKKFYHENSEQFTGGRGLTKRDNKFFYHENFFNIINIQINESGSKKKRNIRVIFAVFQKFLDHKKFGAIWYIQTGMSY